MHDSWPIVLKNLSNLRINQICGMDRHELGLSVALFCQAEGIRCDKPSSLSDHGLDDFPIYLETVRAQATVSKLSYILLGWKYQVQTKPHLENGEIVTGMGLCSQDVTVTKEHIRPIIYFQKHLIVIPQAHFAFKVITRCFF